MKRHTYRQVRLAVPRGDGQLNGGQLHFFPDLGPHLLGKGCVGVLDSGQVLPLASHYCPTGVASLSRLRTLHLSFLSSLFYKEPRSECNLYA